MASEARKKPTLIKRQRAKELRQHQTDEENTLWQRLRRNQLEGLHIRRQHPIGAFIVDFYCGEARMVVELDGSVHEDNNQRSYDAERDALLAGRGLLVMRIANAEVRTNLTGVLNHITATCAPRLPGLPMPSADHAQSPSLTPPSRSTGRGPGG